MKLRNEAITIRIESPMELSIVREAIEGSEANVTIYDYDGETLMTGERFDVRLVKFSLVYWLSRKGRRWIKTHAKGRDWVLVDLVEKINEAMK